MKGNDIRVGLIKMANKVFKVRPWIKTRNGLNKYDGGDFWVFNQVSGN